jgi:hypothetical protein
MYGLEINQLADLLKQTDRNQNDSDSDDDDQVLTKIYFILFYINH